MAGKNEAQAAARLHTNVVIPMIEARRRAGTPVRLAFGTITAVGDGFAMVDFGGGVVAPLRYGMTAPAVGERWRAIAYDGGALILDDLAVAA